MTATRHLVLVRARHPVLVRAEQPATVTLLLCATSNGLDPSGWASEASGLSGMWPQTLSGPSGTLSQLSESTHLSLTWSCTLLSTTAGVLKPCPPLESCHHKREPPGAMQQDLGASRPGQCEFISLAQHPSPKRFSKWDQPGSAKARSDSCDRFSGWCLLHFV